MKKFIVFITVLCTVFIYYSLYNSSSQLAYKQTTTKESLATNKEASVVNEIYSKDLGSYNSYGMATAPLRLVEKKGKCPFLIGNGIEIKSKSEEFSEIGKLVNATLPEISGLRDTDIEDKVNNLIFSDFKETVYLLLKNAPGSTFDSNNFNICFNSNNILSFSQNISYTVGAEKFYFEKGYVYNLINGKPLSLKEVFTTDTDYIGLLNNMVVEEILINSNEDQLLKEPFSSIIDNQNYCFDKDKMTLFFPENTCGFVENKKISVPLKKIDSYTTALEGVVTDNKFIYEKTDAMENINNILCENKFIKISKEKYLINIIYPNFISYTNGAVIDKINTLLERRIKAVENIKFEEELNNEYTQENKEDAKTTFKIEYEITFNSYGKICLVERIKGGNIPQNETRAVLFFDLYKSKQLDGKLLIKSFAKKEKKLEKSMVDKVNRSLNEDFLRMRMGNITKRNYKLDMENILNKASFYFDKTGFTIHFNKGAINNLRAGINIGINCREIFNMDMEEFFKKLPH